MDFPLKITMKEMSWGSPFPTHHLSHAISSQRPSHGPAAQEGPTREQYRYLGGRVFRIQKGRQFQARGKLHYRNQEFPARSSAPVTRRGRQGSLQNVCRKQHAARPVARELLDPFTSYRTPLCRQPCGIHPVGDRDSVWAWDGVGLIWTLTHEAQKNLVALQQVHQTKTSLYLTRSLHRSSIL